MNKNNMEYIAMIIRVLIIGIGIYMIVKNPKYGTPPFMSGVVFILIGIYLGISSVYGVEAVSCVLLK